ncbi:MAG: hypothetical protein C4516_10515 [Oxalobacter sp.]|nr:MAG: hypothetical protein C4516_10515 [Oxalobacter sp.]
MKKMMVAAWRLFLLGLILASPIAGYAQEENPERQLERRRVRIEADRRALNADCSHTPASDVAKMSDCKARHDDIMRRIAEYKADLDKLKSREKAEKCRELSEKIARFERGLRRIADVMEKNDRFLKDAQESKNQAKTDMAGLAGELAGAKAAELLQNRLNAFLKAKENLQAMKKGLDEAEKLLALKKNSRKLTKKQITQARKWLNNGMKYGEEVADLAAMGVQYYKAPGSGASPSAAYSEKLMRALKNFNQHFMNDAGGWEFAGEHLSEYVGGPLGKLAFKTTVVGIKTQVATASYLISDAEMGELNYNQGKMRVEQLKLERRINDLKSTHSANQCNRYQ